MRIVGLWTAPADSTTSFGHDPLQARVHELNAHSPLVFDEDANDGLAGEQDHAARSEVRTQISVDRAASALVSDRRLHRRDADLTLAVIVGIIGNPIFLECLEAILVQLIDALGQLDRQATIYAVIFVVEGVVVLLRHEDGKQVFDTTIFRCRRPRPATR